MSTTEMPGTTPEAMDTGLRLVLPGRTVGAGQGWTWIARGWKLFAAAPLMWIISIVVLVVIAIVLGLIPVLGQVAMQILQTVLIGGFMWACRCLEKGGEFELEHLFAGFTRRFANLAIVGVLYLVGELIILLVFGMFVGFTVLGAILTGNQEHIVATFMASAGTLLLGMLVCLALLVPLMAAYWFAPALVMLHDMAPMAAMKASFSACLRNFVPFLLYGVIALVLCILAAIPFGLGFLVLGPVLIASVYTGYRDVFTEDDAAVPAAMA